MNRICCVFVRVHSALRERLHQAEEIQCLLISAALLISPCLPLLFKFSCAVFETSVVSDGCLQPAALCTLCSHYLSVFISFANRWNLFGLLLALCSLSVRPQAESIFCVSLFLFSFWSPQVTMKMFMYNYKLAGHFVRYTLLVLGWTCFCLQNCLHSLWHRLKITKEISSLKNNSHRGTKKKILNMKQEKESLSVKLTENGQKDEAFTNTCSSLEDTLRY